MKKKIYLMPSITTASMDLCQFICQSKLNTPIGDNDETPSGGWGEANTKEYNDWDDDWE